MRTHAGCVWRPQLLLASRLLAMRVGFPAAAQGPGSGVPSLLASPIWLWAAVGYMLAWGAAMPGETRLSLLGLTMWRLGLHDKDCWMLRGAVQRARPWMHCLVGSTAHVLLGVLLLTGPGTGLLLRTGPAGTSWSVRGIICQHGAAHLSSRSEAHVSPVQLAGQAA